jgi:hypothetical protein
LLPVTSQRVAVANSPTDQPVRSRLQLQDGECLRVRITELKNQGQTAATIAGTLKAEGFVPPRQRGDYNASIVYGLQRTAIVLNCQEAHMRFRMPQMDVNPLLVRIAPIHGAALRHPFAVADTSPPLTRPELNQPTGGDGFLRLVNGCL